MKKLRSVSYKKQGITRYSDEAPPDAAHRFSGKKQTTFDLLADIRGSPILHPPPSRERPAFLSLINAAHQKIDPEQTYSNESVLRANEKYRWKGGLEALKPSAPRVHRQPIQPVLDKNNGFRPRAFTVRCQSRIRLP
jgi:hypothetical protein